MLNKQYLIDTFMDGIRTGVSIIVKHKTKGSEYMIEMVVHDATNSNDGGYIVIYREMNAVSKRWAREINEFCDGRFEIVE